ncbi:hypothetical protein D3C76_1007250 [compost metagenome]
MSIEAPRLGLGILVDNFKDYLGSIGAKTKERNFYYLREEGFFSQDERPPVLVDKYREVLRFVGFLGESAHYLDSSKEELVFYKDGRFVVPVSYGEAEIRSFSLASFNLLERQLSDGLHREQKLKLLGESLIEMLGSVPAKERFSYLLNNVQDLYGRFVAGYNIFASDFTYEKAVAEVHAFKVDVITKIHKAITDIQAQVLGIPIATFVALSQLKKTVSLDAQFAANTVIFLGVFIFCLLLTGFLVNQKTTLDTIDGEVSRQRKVFEKKFQENTSAYIDEFGKIDSRLFWQYAALVAVGCLNVLMLLGSFVYYSVHTRPVFDALFG